jgi:hypothetical protein
MKVLPSLFGSGRRKALSINRLRFPKNLETRLPAILPVSGRERNPRLITQKPDRFPKRLSLKLFNEPENVSTSLTSKAVKKLL